MIDRGPQVGVGSRRLHLLRLRRNRRNMPVARG